MIVAVDTGGTKTLIALFSDNGGILRSDKFPTPRKTEDYIEQVAATIRQLCENDEPTIISIALPNIQTTGYVAHFNNLPWKNFDVLFELSPHFPHSQLLVGNDAKLGGLGEVRSMGREYPKKALYTTISTGIGTGVIVDGNMDEEFERCEGGSMMLEYNGVTQMWESFASGNAIHETYKKYGSEITSLETWHQIADRISRGFLALIPILQPDIIIIGGSMGVHFAHFSQDLQDLIDETLPPTISRPQFMQARHPEEAVIYGCYYHALDEQHS